MHLMGNDDDGLSVVTHIAQHREQLLGLLGGQHGGGLVQDQDVRPAVKDLDDLHGLLLGNGHVVDLLIGIHLKAIGVTDLLHLPGHLVNIQPPRLLQTQNDVFGGGQHVHQLEMLMDHSDTIAEGVLGGTDHRFLIVDEDLAFVREINTGEHVHQGRLTAAVFSQQGKNLPFVDIQPHPVIGQDGAEPLGDVPHFYRGGFIFQRAHSFFFVRQLPQRAARRASAAFPFEAENGKPR